MRFVGQFAAIASVLLVTYVIVMHASSPSAWFAYVVLAWALAPYFYLLLQLRWSETPDEHLTRTAMALGCWLSSLYLSVQSLGHEQASESQLLWLFGPLAQWLLMMLISILVTIILLRRKRGQKTR